MKVYLEGNCTYLYLEGRTALTSPVLVPQGRSLRGGRPHLLGPGNALSHRTLIFSDIHRGPLTRDRKEKALSFLSAGTELPVRHAVGLGLPQLPPGVLAHRVAQKPR